MIKAFLLSLVLAAGAIATALADPIDDAQAAYDAGNFTAALHLFQPLADQGNADAEIGLGLLNLGRGGIPEDGRQAVMWFARAIEHGKPQIGWLLGQIFDGSYDLVGVPQDLAQAVKWYTVAAEADWEPAWYQLAEHYDQGRGVPQNYVAAVTWYGKLAEFGDMISQNRLGEIYGAGGWGVSQDYALSAEWFREAADQGYAGAQYRLGLLYEGGLGVNLDYIEAYKWLTLAATVGFPSYPEDKEAALGARNAVAEQMTPEQTAEGRRLAGAWKPK